jgi:hypothetical protein
MRLWRQLLRPWTKVVIVLLIIFLAWYVAAFTIAPDGR